MQGRTLSINKSIGLVSRLHPLCFTIDWRLVVALFISTEFTLEQQAELAALADLPDEAIDTQDIPETGAWQGAKRGLFYRPVKQQITLRLDT